jgi:hypothetical protein
MPRIVAFIVLVVLALQTPLDVDGFNELVYQRGERERCEWPVVYGDRVKAAHLHGSGTSMDDVRWFGSATIKMRQTRLSAELVDFPCMPLVQAMQGMCPGDKKAIRIEWAELKQCTNVPDELDRSKPVLLQVALGGVERPQGLLVHLAEVPMFAMLGSAASLALLALFLRLLYVSRQSASLFNSEPSKSKSRNRKKKS